MSEKADMCPHCGEELKKWLVPDEATWDDEFFLVCFNNECPYYKRGWEWMKEKYARTVSYRYRINPENGKTSPLPVWSETAMLDRIIPEKGEE